MFEFRQRRLLWFLCLCTQLVVLSCASVAEEDRYDSYSRMILKYFLAEGVICRHELFVATAQDDPDEILQVWMHLISSSSKNLSQCMTNAQLFATRTTRTGANLAAHCPTITIRWLLFDCGNKTTRCWTAFILLLYIIYRVLWTGTAFPKTCQPTGGSERSGVARLSHCWNVSRCMTQWRGAESKKPTVSHHTGGGPLSRWLIVGGVTSSPSLCISKAH